MTHTEMQIIQEFARGREDLRSLAIKIYQRYLVAGELDKNVFMLFMSEVDNPIPDLVLRARARAAVKLEVIPAFDLNKWGKA